MENGCVGRDGRLLVKKLVDDLPQLAALVIVVVVWKSHDLRFEAKLKFAGQDHIACVPEAPFKHGRNVFGFVIGAIAIQCIVMGCVNVRSESPFFAKNACES